MDYYVERLIYKYKLGIISGNTVTNHIVIQLATIHDVNQKSYASIYVQYTNIIIAGKQISDVLHRFRNGQVIKQSLGKDLLCYHQYRL